MRALSLALSFLVLASGQGKAANIAIIDSGVDYKHVDLAAAMWTNPNSSTTTPDGTYQNDTHGWNFAEKNNEVIDYKYLGTFSADCGKLFETQAKILQGTATEAEKQWYQQKKADATFKKELSKFGNFVHGTHVAGISSQESPGSKLIALKLIPTESPIGFVRAQMTRLGINAGERGGADNPMAKMMLDMLAGQQVKMLTTTGHYVHATKAEVANGSFGTSVAAVAPAIAGVLKMVLGHEPTEQEKKDYGAYFVAKIAEESKKFVGAAPETLFVFAAGNDGTDNDSLPVSPANVKASNAITVAATMGVSTLASFTNYGRTMVEVAAPGVAIMSTIPGDAHLPMSGTSMAAPFVTNVAGLVKDTNKSLAAADVKKVLMETVDVKSFLSGKVSTSGIVNKERALRAAELSLRAPLAEAIRMARLEIQDVRETSFVDANSRAADVLVLPLPSPF